MSNGKEQKKLISMDKAYYVITPKYIDRCHVCIYPMFVMKRLFHRIVSLKKRRKEKTRWSSTSKETINQEKRD